MLGIQIQISSHEDNSVWKFPMKDSVLSDKLESIGGRETVFISNVIWPEGLRMLNGLAVCADELNFLAKCIRRFGNTECDQFLAAASQEKSPGLEELINLAFNINHYTVIRDVSDLVGIGQIHLMNIRGGLTKDELKTIDFAQVAKNLLLSGRGVPTDYGLLFENEEVPVRQVYDGTTFPCYLFRSDVVALCTVEYGSRTEYLYLPEEEITINKALERLGAPSQEECKIEVESAMTSHAEWPDWFSGILEHEGLDVLNFLCETLSKDGMDWDKLTAVVHYAEVACGEDIEKLARHLDDFVFIKGNSCQTNADIGEYFTDHDPEYEVPPGLYDFIDFDALGEYLREDRDGGFVAGGFVCVDNGCSLKHILDETRQGMTMGGY